MGQNQSQLQPSGLVTVSTAKSSAPDPDSLALQSLPPCAPLLRPPSTTTLRGMFTSAKPGGGFPRLSSSGATSICKHYSSFVHDAAPPLCEAQLALTKKMDTVQALCTRILYLMSLRSAELTACAAALRELPSIATEVAEARARVMACEAHAKALEEMLSKAAFAQGGTCTEADEVSRVVETEEIDSRYP
ncbi:hypothetical protein AB1Y20_010813 [Prymnesium parvum]|uniref:Mediator of RNA polymerase II transcription subunit 7 n=1 Tax=Prymnesium parvum TaxID=97485 RepID=A0AB34ISD5_PRYPA|mmetsp:Transcript_5200/g.12757  ORF Transcript_5200/g.12757 Transcript_5200/m.12757 type:complete len:190 (+) Transcript_5200:2-571(+)